jgi:hypothetical protein
MKTQFIDGVVAVWRMDNGIIDLTKKNQEGVWLSLI